MSSSDQSNEVEQAITNGEEQVDEVDELLDSTSSRSSGIPRSPLYWFVDNQSNPSTKLEQTQLGIYRSLFPVPSEEELNSNPEWHSKTLSSIQAGHFVSQTDSNSNTSNHKRMKGTGIQDSAIPLGLVVLDGRNQLKSMGLTEDIEEEEEGYEESESDSSDVETSTTISHLSQFTPSPNDGLLISPPSSILRTFTIILYGGGHFAASIIALPLSYTPPTRKGISEKGVLVLASKTFHRYTTRRKQGGSQSSHDGSGSFAKSVGASLRRAGEQALKEEVRELLGSRIWRRLLLDTEKVFVQGNVREARGMLWNWENSSTPHKVKDSPLEESKKDGRIQNIPFVTKRPTLSECLRVFFELTKVKITRKTEEELKVEDENYYQLLRGGKKGERERERLEIIKKKKEEERLKRKEMEEMKLKEKAEKSKSKLSPEELRRRDRFERLVGIVRKGKLGAMVDLLGKYEMDLFRGQGGWDGEKIEEEEESESIDENEMIERRRKRINSELPIWWRIEQASLDPKSQNRNTDPSSKEKEGQTSSLTGMGPLIPNNLLQLAAETGDEEILKYLLIERRADPTLSIPPVPSSNPSSIPTYPHRTAYDLLPTKSSRNVFRRIMALNPDWYPWDSMDFGGARVPAALNFQKEQIKKDKMKDRRNMLREKAKTRENSRTSSTTTLGEEVKKVEEEKKVEVKSNPSRNRLGGPGNGIPNALRNLRDQEAGLTPEMKMRIEREKRARAAEARLKGLGSK